MFTVSDQIKIDNLDELQRNLLNSIDCVMETHHDGEFCFIYEIADAAEHLHPDLTIGQIYAHIAHFAQLNFIKVLPDCEQIHWDEGIHHMLSINKII